MKKRMNKKTIIAVCIVVLLFGSAIYLWVNRDVIIPAIEASHTDRITAGIKDTLETVTARIEEQDSKTRTEVRVIRETVRTKVNALPADSVASGLNAELSIFRGVEAGAGGLDDD
jgi:hypothetical protein